MKPLRLSFAQICERCGETSGGFARSLRSRFAGASLASSLFMRQKYQPINVAPPPAPTPK